jgi:hypothetical protein
MGDCLGLDAWGDEPEYKRCDTFTLRGGFILNKLLQRHPARLIYVMANLYGADKKDPQDITKAEWKVILKSVGASPEEIMDVQMRMGRVWR